MRYHEPFLGGGAVLLHLLGAEPFVRWVGGKRRLLLEIVKRLHRPGCALDEATCPPDACGCLAFDSFTAADSNADLVALYRAVREDVDALMRDLAAIPRTPATYLAVRDGSYATTPAARAAYLNLFGFNGIWRTNRAGQYNVPVDPKRLDRFQLKTFEDAARAAAPALQRCAVLASDFRPRLARLGEGDVVYLDPPYRADAGQGTASKFRSYAGVFTETDQLDLAMLAGEAASRGARVVASNSLAAAPLYEAQRTSRVAVDVAVVVDRTSVGATGDRRGERREILVTLYPA